MKRLGVGFFRPPQEKSVLKWSKFPWVQESKDALLSEPNNPRIKGRAALA